MQVIVPGSAPSESRELVMAYGRNSTACQILNPGISHWFSARRDAVVGYVRQGAWILVAGEPMCSAETLPGAVLEFEQHLARQGRKVCYVCAEDSLRDLLAPSASHSSITIGAQPVWNPADWPAIVQSRSSLRAQLRRSINKDVRIESMPAQSIAGSW